MLKKIVDSPRLGVIIRAIIVGTAICSLVWAFWHHGKPSHFVAVSLGLSVLVFVAWYVFPVESYLFTRKAVAYWRTHWRRVIGVSLIIGAFIVVPAQYTLVLIIGILIAFYVWVWWQKNTRHAVKCACGGNVTHLAGHCPCGCSLPEMTREEIDRYHKQHK